MSYNISKNTLQNILHEFFAFYEINFGVRKYLHFRADCISVDNIYIYLFAYLSVVFGIC